MAIDPYVAESDFDQCFRAAKKTGTSMSLRYGKTDEADTLMIVVATGRSATKLYKVVSGALDLVASVRAWRS